MQLETSDLAFQIDSSPVQRPDESAPTTRENRVVYFRAFWTLRPALRAFSGGAVVPEAACAGEADVVRDMVPPPQERPDIRCAGCSRCVIFEVRQAGQNLG